MQSIAFNQSLPEVWQQKPSHARTNSARGIGEENKRLPLALNSTPAWSLVINPAAVLLEVMEASKFTFNTPMGRGSQVTRTPLK